LEWWKKPLEILVEWLVRWVLVGRWDD